MKTLLRLTSFGCAALLFGCATHTSETQSAREHWAAGNTTAAQADVAARLADKDGSGDKLVWLLEMGSVSRANKDIPASIRALSEAHGMIMSYEDESDVKLSEEATAMLTNQSYIPYKGYNYDKIMVGTYQALNYIEFKDFDAAAVELKRLENFQRNAEEANRKRIEREEAALKEAQAKEKDGGYDAGKTLSDPAARSKLKEIYGEDFNPDTSSMQAKGIYVNPFSYWLSGLFFMNKAADSADKGRASDFFRLAAEMGGNKSALILSDMKTAEDFANGVISELPNVTYVIYETGVAPIRKQIRLDLPLYIIAGDIPHVGINFPYLSKDDSVIPDLTIVTTDGMFTTETLASMDSIVSEEFYNILPMIITKTIVSAAVKAAAQYGVKQAAGDGWGGLIANISMSVYQIMMNDADLRTWTTLPKEIRIAKFATPADGMVFVGGNALSVNLKGTNVILAKKISPTAPLLARKFDFLEASAAAPAPTAPLAVAQ